MFIKLAQTLVDQRPDLTLADFLEFHPAQLEIALDRIWEAARTRTSPVQPLLPVPGIGDRTPASQFQSLSDELLRVLQGPYSSGKDLGGSLLADVVGAVLANFERARAPRLWHTLIYAYLIENTRAFEIFAAVLEEAFHGERLGTVSEAGQRWLRTTEQLFFKTSGWSFISALQSTLRPDPRATRRNAYYRFYKLDLNHGTRENQPYPYVKPEAANRDFVPTLEAFLREIWRGYTNSRNTSGASTTDDAILADLALKLSEMLSERRTNGNLSREEYVAVCTAAWFHLTLSAADAPIVQDLQATASTPEERLRKIGERVGIPAHSRSRALFRLAEPLSRLLIQIEAGRFNDVADVSLLYDPARPNHVTGDTLEIINHWSTATGHDLKALPVVASR